MDRQKLNKRKMTRGLILLGSAVALAANPIWMAAQQQPGAGPSAGTPLPGAQPTTGLAGPEPLASTAPSVVTNKPKPATTQISMRFKDAPIDAVLQHLSEAAGYQVLKIAPIDERVTVWSDQPISPEKAVELLNSLLKEGGYTAVLQGTELKILTIEKASKQSIPVHFGADPELIPLTDTLVTQVIPLKTLDSVKLKADLQPLISTTADLTANAASNSIMITDTSANIHRVVEIVASMDKRDELENDIIVRQLKYADAAATAKLILDIFQPSTSTQQQGQQGGFGGFGGFFRGFGGGGGGAGGGGRGGGGGGFPGGGGPGGGGGGAGAGSDNDKGKTGTITASSDARTNTIVVTGPKDTLAVIKTEILDKIDANPVTDTKFFTYHVKNGQAVDMQNTLNTLFGASITSPTSNRSSGVSSSTGNRTSSGFGSSSGSSGGFGGSSGSSGLGSTANRGGSSGSSNTGSSQNRGGVASGGGTSGTSGALSGTAELLGQVEVVADADTNSLLVVTATKYEEQVRQIIEDLDRPVRQVLIKVLIAEVTHDRSDDLGVDWSILNLSKGLSGGSTLGNITSATANGGLAVTLAESQISATFHALAVAGKLDVLSRPYILTSDNQEATILVGQEVPFITDSRTDALGELINTIQYQDIGIILDVTPHVNQDGLVVMDVDPQISSQSDVSVPIEPGVNAPVFNQRSASTHVGVMDGNTIVIGGLMQDQKIQTINKVPVLGDIPWLGLLFQRDQVSKTKTELLIFLTPHVAQSPEHLVPMSIDEMKGVHLTPGAVQKGVFQEQIKGMQLGGSATQPSLPIPKPEFDRDAWEPEPKMP